jgi:hypothetical protein
MGTKMKRSELVFIAKLHQKYQMIPDCLGHCGLLPVWDPELCGGLPHIPGQPIVVGVAHVYGHR